MWTVAAANKKLEGPLGSYNGLTDQHLAHYFSSPVIRAHLIKIGLVTEDGIVVPESVYKLQKIQQEKKKNLHDLLANAIVQKTLHLECTRQATIRHHLEDMAKIELVERIKSAHHRRKSRFIKKDLIPKSRKCRPSSCGPTLMSTQKSQSKNYSKRSKNGFSSSWCGNGYQYSNIHQDSSDSEKESHSMGVVPTSRTKLTPPVSPYLFSFVLHRSNRPMSVSRKRQKSAESNMLTRKSKNNRAKSATVRNQKEWDNHHNYKSEDISRLLSSSQSQNIYNIDNSSVIKKKSRKTSAQNKKDEQTQCRVTFYYHGNKQCWLMRHWQDQAQEIVVQQQHCGGNPVVVFRGSRTFKETLTFTSRRHGDYPFSVIVSVDGMKDLQLSACCEYRYPRGSRLGGRHGHFSLFNTEGGSPCLKCQFEKSLGLYRPRHPVVPKFASHQKQINKPITSDLPEILDVQKSLSDFIAAEGIYAAPNDNEIAVEKLESESNVQSEKEDNSISENIKSDKDEESIQEIEEGFVSQEEEEEVVEETPDINEEINEGASDNSVVEEESQQDSHLEKTEIPSNEVEEPSKGSSSPSGDDDVAYPEPCMAVEYNGDSDCEGSIGSRDSETNPKTASQSPASEHTNYEDSIQLKKEVMCTISLSSEEDVSKQQIVTADVHAISSPSGV